MEWFCHIETVKLLVIEHINEPKYYWTFFKKRRVLKCQE